MLCVDGELRSRLWDLKTPAFRWTGHVKKGRAGVLYVLEALGPMRLKALAEEMGWGNHRELWRRYVAPLVDMGLIEDRDGLLSLPDDHAERVEEVRRAPYTIVCRRGRKSVDPATRREVRWVEETESTASEAEREEKQARDTAEQRRAFRLHLAKKSPEADEGCRELLNAWDDEREFAAGEISELEKPTPAPHPAAEDPLVAALRGFFDRNPHRAGETPSWLSVALWADEFLPSRPPPAEVESALVELMSEAA